MEKKLEAHTNTHNNHTGTHCSSAIESTHKYQMKITALLTVLPTSYHHSPLPFTIIFLSLSIRSVMVHSYSLGHYIDVTVPGKLSIFDNPLYIGCWFEYVSIRSSAMSWLRIIPLNKYNATLNLGDVEESRASNWL